MMKRRDFITLLGGAAAAWPLVARAQQPGRVRWVGVLIISPDDQVGRAKSSAFEQGLEKLRWEVGRNLAIDYRWGVSDLEKARFAVAQILRLTPDVIVANGGFAVTAAQQAIRTVPIVFTGLSEPVERGFIASLARPGGNTTGFTNLEPTIGAKWLELLKEIAPGTKRVAVMFNPESSGGILFARSAEAAAQKFAVQVVTAPVHDPAEIEAALTMLGREPGGGLILPPDGLTPAYRKMIVELTLRYKLPMIGQSREFARDGSLMSYGVDLNDQYRQAADYVDRILRGEKPADLPVQQPVKFELVINMKTAKALGLTVPVTLQVAADEVIE
jgi:putative ABC transport system substrate-binding protein